MKNITLLMLAITMCLIAACSDDQNLAINQLPGDFEILSPFYGAENVVLNPELRWEVADGLDGDIRYSIYLDIDDATTLLENNIETFEYKVTQALEPNTTYKWKVIAEDDSGATLETGVSIFTTSGAPSDFSLLSPLDGQEGVSLLPILTWSESIDPERNVILYELYLDETSGSNLLASNFTQNSFATSDSLKPESQYQWKVIATDGDGGRTETTISSFKTGLHGNWEEILPTFGLIPIRQHTSLVYNDNIWIIGGRSLGILEAGDNVYKSSDGMTWEEVTTGAGFPERSHHASVVFDGKMWVIGGSSDGLFEDLSDVWSSGDGITWVNAGATGLPQMMDHSAVVFDNKIWVMHQSGIYNSNDGVNWATVESTTYPARLGPRSLVFDNQMWIIGGRDVETGYINDVWQSSDGITWTQVTASAEFSERVLHSVVVFDDKMWVIGGFGNTVGELSDTWYSEDGERWYEILTNEELFPERFYHTSVTFNEGIITIGGVDTNNDLSLLSTDAALDDIWSFHKQQ